MPSPFRTRGRLLCAILKPVVPGLLALAAAITAPPLAHAYEVDTHEGLSNLALQRPDCIVDDYLINQLILPDGIQTLSGTETLLRRLELGARDEDAAWPTRPRHHFYNPINNSGLNDHAWGTNSMQWAYDDWLNANDWRAAREAYQQFFTGNTKALRMTGLGNAFFNLGHVIHLVQDCAQPQHTRNDAHITNFPGAPYEDYCHIHYGNAGAIATLGGWPIPAFSGAVSPFQGVPNTFAAFWDTGQYTGQPLFGGFFSTPGLAEYSNAYFITDDTMFGNIRLSMLTRAAGPPLTVRLQSASNNHSTDANHLMPSPLFNATNVASFFAPPTNTVTLVRRGEGLPAANRYADLNARDLAGNIVHTTRNVFALNAANEIGFDDVVYQSNAQDLLPKAVAYSAGVLNYFFRGKLEIAVRWQEAAQRYQITIKNVSGYDLGAGTWTLYQDDASENRSSIAATFSYPGTLPDGGSFNGTFAATTRSGAYTLVFRGTLGDETELAVVGKRFEIVRVHITWTPRSDQDIQMWGPGGSLIWWNNLITTNGELDNDNIGGLGPENITLKDLTPGTYTFMINYYRDWWREKFFDSPSQTCLPYSTPVNTPDDLPQFYVCHTPTPISVTMQTFHNSSSPVRTLVRTVQEQNYGDLVPADGSGEGAVGDSWFVTQIVTVDDERNVTIVGAGPQPAPPAATRPIVQLMDWKAPRKGDTPSKPVSEVRP